MKFFSFLKENLLETLFPSVCVGCRKPKTFLCDQCIAAIPIHVHHTCPICKEKNTPYGRVCFICRQNSSLDGVLVASPYKHHTLAKTIHSYKYHFIQDLSEPLSQLLLQSIRTSDIPLPDLLCPVPLHPIRLRWRGFNQSEILAMKLSRQLIPQLEIPLVKNLVRHRFTLPQMSIDDARERNENIHNAFIWKDTSDTVDIRGKYIWVIDDITTTASTLDECAKALKQAGAKEVFGVVLAR